MNGHNSSGARLLGEVICLTTTSENVLQTGVPQPLVLLGLLPSLGGRAANSHPETRREARDLLVSIVPEVLLCVVDSHATDLSVVEDSVGVLGHLVV